MCLGAGTFQTSLDPDAMVVKKLSSVVLLRVGLQTGKKKKSRGIKTQLRDVEVWALRSSCAPCPRGAECAPPQPSQASREQRRGARGRNACEVGGVNRGAGRESRT